MNISVLKGPCLAKELARKNQTNVILANKNIKIAKRIGKMISTKYYVIEFSNDIIGVEICSAIKNIYAMIIGSGQSLNTSSSLFQQSIIEMQYLTKYFKGKEVTTLGLAGIGDLYVSAAGGRNSKMGSYLGKGFTFNKAKKKFMPKDTVEGEQLAREIAPYILKKISKKKIPLMTTLLKAILNNKKLNTLIEVDGGINLETSKLCIEAGADILVAGSAIFSEDKSNYSQIIQSLRNKS